MLLLLNAILSVKTRSVLCFLLVCQAVILSTSMAIWNNSRWNKLLNFFFFFFFFFKCGGCSHLKPQRFASTCESVWPRCKARKNKLNNKNRMTIPEMFREIHPIHNVCRKSFSNPQWGLPTCSLERMRAS